MVTKTMSRKLPNDLLDAGYSPVCLVLSCIQSSSLPGLTPHWANILHSSRSSYCLNISITDRFIHVVMLLIYVIHCPPILRDPGNVPCMISFSRLSHCFLMAWPQYDNFLYHVVASSSLFVPAFSKTKTIHLFSFLSMKHVIFALHHSFQMHLGDNIFHCPTLAPIETRQLWVYGLADTQTWHWHTLSTDQAREAIWWSGIIQMCWNLNLHSDGQV